MDLHGTIVSEAVTIAKEILAEHGATSGSLVYAVICARLPLLTSRNLSPSGLASVDFLCSPCFSPTLFFSVSSWLPRALVLLPPLGLLQCSSSGEIHHWTGKSLCRPCWSLGPCRAVCAGRRRLERFYLGCWSRRPWTKVKLVDACGRQYTLNSYSPTHTTTYPFLVARPCHAVT